MTLDERILAAASRPKFVARFWAKVDKSGDCWLWTGAHNLRYGKVYVGPPGERFWAYVHRVSWVIAHGIIPAGEGYHGTCVCHHCDVKLCVRPDHLFLGTQRDNLRDMSAKGRWGNATRNLGSI